MLQVRIATLHRAKMQQNGKFSHISNAFYDAEFVTGKAKQTLNNHIKIFCLNTKISQAVLASQKRNVSTDEIKKHCTQKHQGMSSALYL